MNESPYLLGKMLNLADGLHKLYCEENRNNDIPRELLGGIFYVQIANHPRQAFGALGIRMIPYLKWAKTTKEKLAHWYLKEFSAVSDALQQNGIPEKLTDADKAQMLLGYLGSLKAKDETLNKSNT